MTVMQAIEARRSIRHYTQQPVTDEELMAVLEAGRLAPSARNAQSWQFTAVREKSLLEKLAVDHGMRAIRCDGGLLHRAELYVAAGYRAGTRQLLAGRV